HDATVALPTVAGGAAAADPGARTEALPVAGGTAVMPVPLQPGDSSPRAAGLARRPWLVAALAAGLAFVLVLAANSGGGIDGLPTPTPPSTEGTDPISQLEPEVTTTVAPTTTAPPPTTEAVDTGKPEKPEKPGRGEGRDNDDDD
ncbi:MAG: hypothetical protein ACSLFP_14115, partial [Acidimicrobiales bacterium]